MKNAPRLHGVDACAAGDLVALSEADDLGPCPSCGAMIATSNESNPHNGGQIEPTVIHPIPFCAYFGQTDADAIVHDMLVAAQSKAAKA